ncbi:hypothetical protein [Vibrio sp. HB161653]|uniref:hypothetical protein n=1 Tax=Vibrio sp. HB161653 TaxID=3068274 RepID=UPI00273EC062|nr:hypothetical protein [Vibrio sp. HB161653]MDP5255842.1 hypothetical protein [Vibrio sp. HB161653]
MSNRPIDAPTLRALVEAGVIREALIVRIRHDGDYRWAIQVSYGMKTQILRSQREPVRLFHTIDSAARLLHDMGLSRMSVEFV